MFYDSIKNYSPKLANGGTLMPYLIKKKIYFISILIGLIIAKKRYFLFGKKNKCMIPDSSISAKFLSLWLIWIMHFKHGLI